MTKLRKYTLCIIDVQPNFNAAKRNRKLIKKIKKEIAHAIKLSNHIMFVWLTCSGKITPALKAAVRGYSNVSYVGKVGQNGGSEVLAALPAYTHIRFCGVNTNQCVEDTVITIAKFLPRRFKIQVVADGCASYYPDDHSSALDRMGTRTNITIDRAA